MAMMKMVDMAMIRAVARWPWPESSAGIGERRRNAFEGPSPKPQRPPEDPVGCRNASRDHTWPKDLALKVCFGC